MEPPTGGRRGKGNEARLEGRRNGCQKGCPDGAPRVRPRAPAAPRCGGSAGCGDNDPGRVFCRPRSPARPPRRAIGPGAVGRRRGQGRAGMIHLDCGSGWRGTPAGPGLRSLGEPRLLGRHCWDWPPGVGGLAVRLRFSVPVSGLLARLKLEHHWTRGAPTAWHPPLPLSEPRGARSVRLGNPTLCRGRGRAGRGGTGTPGQGPLYPSSPSGSESLAKSSAVDVGSSWTPGRGAGWRSTRGLRASGAQPPTRARPCTGVLATPAPGNKGCLSRKREGKGSRPQTRSHPPLSFHHHPTTAAALPREEAGPAEARRGRARIRSFPAVPSRCHPEHSEGRGRGLKTPRVSAFWGGTFSLPQAS